jgi:hypothetical protein
VLHFRLPCETHAVQFFEWGKYVMTSARLEESVDKPRGQVPDLWVWLKVLFMSTSDEVPILVFVDLEATLSKSLHSIYSHTCIVC